MPKEIFDSNYTYLPHSHLLSFEEIARLAKCFVREGVKKIRLTGGEPLLRKNIERLIEQLSSIVTLDGSPLDLALTTNGSLLERKAQGLKDAGLQRITVSLDALDDSIFKAMNDVEFPVSDVLKGIEKAHAVGLSPIKVNMVVKQSVNTGEILPMIRHFLNSGIALRFIEYMDVGETNGWNMADVMPSAEILQMLRAHYSVTPVMSGIEGETASQFQLHSPLGGNLQIGLISSVTQAFCESCNRARLSTEGQLYLCLFASSGHDLRSLLRGGATDQQIETQIAQIWSQREDQYSMQRVIDQNNALHTPKRVEMSYIGG